MPYNWSLRKARSYWESRFSLLFAPHRNTRPTTGSNVTPNDSTFFPNTIIGNLRFWITYLSWFFCSICFSILPLPLLPHYSRRFRSLKSIPCPCTSSDYVVPLPYEIPELLAVLAPDDLYVLRPFDVDLGPYIHRQYGYRARTALFSLSCSQLSVQEKINAVLDPSRQLRLQRAYNFLMSLPTSAYKDYITKREELISLNANPGKLEVFNWTGIECALWPTLYPYTSWCESAIGGTVNRKSSKRSFIIKCSSSILNYSLHFDLLQYVFDRWTYKTITGAINQGRILNCSPYSSLGNKAFSPAYWEWQHRYLLDIVRQYGYLSLFITISPSEWTFTLPQWLHNIKQRNTLGPTQTPFFETTHFIHVLEQIVRGYLCGTNDQRWKSHFFNYNGLPRKTSVKTFFYRFEFQG